MAIEPVLIRPYLYYDTGAAREGDSEYAVARIARTCFEYIANCYFWLSNVAIGVINHVYDTFFSEKVDRKDHPVIMGAEQKTAPPSAREAPPAATPEAPDTPPRPVTAPPGGIGATPALAPRVLPEPSAPSDGTPDGVSRSLADTPPLIPGTPVIIPRIVTHPPGAPQKPPSPRLNITPSLPEGAERNSHSHSKEKSSASAGGCSVS